MDNAALLSIARRYGTPTFVFDELALAERMREAKAIVGPDVHLCYSIKANPFLIPAMTALTELLEVCSPGELSICEQLRVAPETILFSGVNKTAADVCHAIDAGVRLFTAESPLHVRLINEAALERGLVLPTLLRLTAGSQFGMDESDLRDILARRAEYPGLRIVGLHYFSGTQRKKLDSQRKELAMLEALMDDLERTLGFVTERLEYGPGLYFPYFAHEDDSDTLAPLRELAPDLQRVAARTELTIEMGRFFASACGTYLTEVIDTKINCGCGYAIVDGGIHHVNYLGGNMGMRVPRIEHLRCDIPRDTDVRDWTLCGSLCTTADVLVRKAAFDGLTPGDVLAFRYIGAYSVTEGPALFLSRDMPRIVLHGVSGDRLARDTVHASDLNCPHI